MTLGNRDFALRLSGKTEDKITAHDNSLSPKRYIYKPLLDNVPKMSSPVKVKKNESPKATENRGGTILKDEALPLSSILLQKQGSDMTFKKEESLPNFGKNNSMMS